MKFVATSLSDCFRGFRHHWTGHVMHLRPMFSFIQNQFTVQITTLRKSCPYSELLWSIFDRSQTWVRNLFLYSVQIWENKDQKNPEYGHFLRSASFSLIETFGLNGVRKFINYLEWRFLYHKPDVTEKKDTKLTMIYYILDS